MKVIVTGGQHKGKTGFIRGDLSERKRTLGRDGKCVLYEKEGPRGTGVIPKNGWAFAIRTKHLELPPLELDLNARITAYKDFNPRMGHLNFGEGEI